jgi:hypothetical protein
MLLLFDIPIWEKQRVVQIHILDYSCIDLINLFFGKWIDRGELMNTLGAWLPGLAYFINIVCLFLKVVANELICRDYEYSKLDVFSLMFWNQRDKIDQLLR